MKTHEKIRSIGSLFAGIGGFDLGFEQAGWKTSWQVEINPRNRAVLADRFPHAKRYEDVREVGEKNLDWVDCITAGFPCQDISNAGNSAKNRQTRGLRGERSGLFYEVIRIILEIQPRWVVLENVEALLSSNNGEDFAAVVSSLADCGYLGFWRVLDAQHFGVPQRRRRVFLVAGLGCYPSAEFLHDASPMVGLPTTLGALEIARPQMAFAGNTLSAKNACSRIMLGGEVLIAEEDGWNQMVERQRVSQIHGVCFGLDEANLAETWSAGNAVCSQVARWIAEILKRS